MGQEMPLLKDAGYILPLLGGEAVGKIKAKLLLDITPGTGKVLKTNLRALAQADLPTKPVKRRHDVFEGVTDQVVRKILLNRFREA